MLALKAQYCDTCGWFCCPLPLFSPDIVPLLLVSHSNLFFLLLQNLLLQDEKSMKANMIKITLIQIPHPHLLTKTQYHRFIHSHYTKLDFSSLLVSSCWHYYMLHLAN